MTLKTTHLHLDRFSLDAMVNLVLGGALREPGTSARQLAARLRWKAPTVSALLAQEAAPDVDGADMLSMTLADLDGKSLMRARHAVENEIVRHLILHLNPETCNRLIARILRVGEWSVRRIRVRAGIAPARVMRVARLQAEKRSKAVAIPQDPANASAA